MTVLINAEIPNGYKWLARQPWGIWVAFKRKPRIHKEMEEDMLLSYWGLQRDEYEICGGPSGGDWKKSLRKI
jgi:hypothetical protein